MITKSHLLGATGAAVALCLAAAPANATVSFVLGSVDAHPTAQDNFDNLVDSSLSNLTSTSSGGITVQDTSSEHFVDTNFLGDTDLSWLPVGHGVTTISLTSGSLIKLLSFSAYDDLGSNVHVPVDIFWQVRNGSTVLGSGETGPLTSSGQTFDVSNGSAGFGQLDTYISIGDGNGYNAGHTTPGLGGYNDVFATSLAVPEPTTWALMILGFGGAGAAVRRRRMVAV